MLSISAAAPMARKPAQQKEQRPASGDELTKPALMQVVRRKIGVAGPGSATAARAVSPAARPGGVPTTAASNVETPNNAKESAVETEAVKNPVSGNAAGRMESGANVEKTESYKLTSTAAPSTSETVASSYDNGMGALGALSNAAAAAAAATVQPSVSASTSGGVGSSASSNSSSSSNGIRGDSSDSSKSGKAAATVVRAPITAGRALAGRGSAPTSVVVPVPTPAVASAANDKSATSPSSSSLSPAEASASQATKPQAAPHARHGKKSAAAASPTAASAAEVSRPVNPSIPPLIAVVVPQPSSTKRQRATSKVVAAVAASETTADAPPSSSGNKTNGKKRPSSKAASAKVPATAPVGQKKRRGSKSSGGTTATSAEKDGANGSSAGTLNGKKRARSSNSKKKKSAHADSGGQGNATIIAAATAAAATTKAHQQQEPQFPPSCTLPPTFGEDTKFESFDAFVAKNPLGLGLKLKNVDEKAVVRGFAPWRLQATTAASGTGTATNGSSPSNGSGNGSSSSSGINSAMPPSVFLGTTEVRVNDVIMSVNNLDARAELFNTVRNDLKWRKCGIQVRALNTMRAANQGCLV